MRRTDLIGTTMALSLAVFMSAVATGCGKNDIDTDVTQSEVIETMATIESSEEEQTSETIAEYEVIQLQVPYMVVTSADTFLMDSPDTAGKIVDLPTDTVLTIIGDVNYGGVATEFYYAEYENNENLVEGYVDGKCIDFNVQVEDSLANVTEVEGGDGEETTEVETTEVTTQDVIEETTEIETESVLSVVEIANAEPEFESYTAYTNTACNIRSLPSKKGDLLGTYPINTEVIVVNEIDGWSQLEYDGCIAFIKSTLLSDTMTQVSQPSGNTTQSVPQQQAPQQSQSTGTSLTPEQQAKRDKFIAERGTVQYSDTHQDHTPTQEELDRIRELSQNTVVY